ncbi:MAG: NUDIX domain-containing protein [Clostridia bacterium]|nr:NUDIX domain-containing protein [Clostridia bacterium]
MRILFEFDYKNYDENGTVGYRPSVRGIIRKDGKYAFVYSSKYDYYTFSGGGIEQNETRSLALIREIREELGLEIKPDTIEEYGAIIRKEKGMIDEIFVQENYYYTCEVFDTVVHEQKLENYEADEGFN